MIWKPKIIAKKTFNHLVNINESSTFDQSV